LTSDFSCGINGNELNPKNTLLISILGNSSAMSIYTLNIDYKDTYSFLISHQLGLENAVINKAHRNLTVVEQMEEVNVQDDILSIDADYHIVQFGIVDCAPRLYTQKQGRYLALFPGRKFLIRFMSKHRFFFTKRFPKVYVEKEKFRRGTHSLIETIIEKTRSKKVFVINIPQTTQRMTSRSFGIEKNIDDYNQIIKEVSALFADKVFFIGLYERTKSDPDLMSEDGIHITKKAHKMLAGLICETIRKEEIQ